MHFTLYELGRNFKIQEDLYNEIKKFVKQQNQEITHEQIDHMILLKSTVKEVLRY
jgi:hypothetical protein